jgi:uncharacterized Zn-binding protein involved in type VI secretion
MPAARAGDLGTAPTCGGLVPLFQIQTGSSNVLIGGNRAARMLDLCIACGPAAGRFTSKIGTAMEALGMAADAAEAAVAPDPAMSAALALSAAMSAAQVAADMAAMALSKAMGTDPCIPPVIGPPGRGAVTMGFPNVLIGGFPMINIPDPAGPLLNALKRLGAKKKRRTAAGKCACP